MDEREQQSLRESFLHTFLNDHGTIVLRHLAEFARADQADYCGDPRLDAYLQGRRSVVMEIRRILRRKEQ